MKQEPEVETRRRWPMHLIIALGLTVAAAMAIPAEMVNRPLQDVLGVERAGGQESEDAFGAGVARVDEALASGNPLPEEGRGLEEMEVALQLRRLMRAGPAAVEEVHRARDVLVTYRQMIAEERGGEASREALRAARDRRLAEVLPRHRPQAIREALAELRAQMMLRRSDQEPAAQQ